MDNSTFLPAVASLQPSGNVSDKGFNGEGVAKIAVLITVSLFGTLGNALVILTIRKERKLRIPGNYFIINLTISDIIITAVGIPVIIYNLIREFGSENLEDYFTLVQQGGFCQTTAYLKVIALHVSWYSLAFIALNRYYTVCRMNEYANHFTKKRLLATVFLIWIWVFLINLPIMVGWAVPNNKELNENSTEGYYFSYPRHGPPVIYDRSSHDCVLGVKTQGGYTYANGFFVMSIPLVAIVFCYSLVYMEIVQSRRKMKSALNLKQLRKRYKKERKISLMLAVVVIVFILCWAPVIIYDYTSEVNRDDQGEDKARLIFSWLALSNSAMNPALYAVLSKAFRIGYKKVLLSMLKKFLCGRCRDAIAKNLNDLSSSSESAPSTLRKVLPRRIRRFKRRRHGESDAYTFRSRTDAASSYIDETVSELQVQALGQGDTNKGKRIATTYTSLALPIETPVVNGKKSYTLNEIVVENIPSSTQQIPKNCEKRPSGISGTTEDGYLTQINIDTTGGNINEVPTREKRTFIPLLEKLDNTEDTFTEAGIYLGSSPKKTGSSKHKTENGKRKESRDSKL